MRRRIPWLGVVVCLLVGTGVNGIVIVGLTPWARAPGTFALQDGGLERLQERATTSADRALWAAYAGPGWAMEPDEAVRVVHRRGAVQRTMHGFHETIVGHRGAAVVTAFEPGGQIRSVQIGWPCRAAAAEEWRGPDRATRTTWGEVFGHALPGRVLVIGFAANSALYGVLAALPWLALRSVRRCRRRRRGCCPGCAYDMRGAMSGGCPECGWRRA